MSLAHIPAESVYRLAAHDGSLYSDDPIIAAEAARFMGWTHLARDAQHILPEIKALTGAVRAQGLSDVVLLGMGGSSLAALVMGAVLGGDGPRLHVLDSTCPATVQSALDNTDPSTTIHLVSSKSGGTIEPNALYAIFRDRADTALGREAAGQRFIAITDPGSSLHGVALSQDFRATILTPPEVGGRFSALSAFGLVPAALMGIDVDRLIEHARKMEDTFTEGEGDLSLARAMAGAYDRGHDKLTLSALPPLRTFGVWVEQLVAESLGKHGKGLIPVIDFSDSAELAEGELRLLFSRSGHAHGTVGDVEADDARLGRHLLDDPYELGEWFVYWEYSTALAGVALGINPFDQPDVTRAKEATSAVLAGELEPPRSQLTVGSTEVTYTGALQQPVGTAGSVAEALGHALETLRPGDYIALLAYAPASALAPLESAVADISAALDTAVCLETGPRYLHSTGQLHKGGPNTGLFIMITTRDPADLPVPGQTWTLDRLYRAQAEGDLTTLAANGRRVLRLDVPDASTKSIAAVASALAAAAGDA